MAARKEKQINLLPQEEFAASTVGRILKWLLSTFRIIVIATEMVVMVAFLSRFWLDAQITDLNDKIKQNQAIITSYKSFEESWRSAQKRLKVFANLTNEEDKVLPIMSRLVSYMPPDVSLLTFSLSGDEVQVKASSATEQSINQFMVNLEFSKIVTDVSLSQVETKKDTSLITFTINGKIGKGGI